ncbi:hypothetical protein N9N67_08735 [Bacteriovoracaceae bacterium]|nr:hypothetical protein [Bacteriovoracaceae bacterium]
MKTIYQNTSFKIEKDTPSLAKKVKSWYLIQRFKKKFFLISFILISLAAPISVEYYLNTSYETSLLIIFIFYPSSYVLFRIDKWALSCKNMP